MKAVVRRIRVARRYPGMLGRMVLGVVWHFSLAPLLVITVLAVLAATIFGYLRKVSGPQYPKR